MRTSPSPRPLRALALAWTVAAFAAALAPGCAMHHLARTVGAGNGEVTVSAGGPFLSNLGAAVPLPNLVVHGRYGLIDDLDLDGGLSVTGLAYGLVGLHLGAVGQLYRERGGLAVSASGHGHVLVGLRGPDLRFYPEVGLHLEGMALPWLSLYGGAFAFAQFDPPEGKPPIFAAPYVGVEFLFGGSDEAGHPFGIALEGGWVSPWQSSVSVVAWEPVGLGAVYAQLGFRARFGGLESMNARSPAPARALGLSLVVATLLAAPWFSACTLDGFLFNPRRVDMYRWGEADPNLDGELTDPHPSLVTDADRSEGFLESAHGESIHWVFAHHDAPLATLVYSHGNARNLGRYWDRVERLWTHGFSVLIYDYPGYGRSSGTPTEAGVIEAGAAALAHVTSLPDVDPARLVLMGYSLGGGPTYALAARAARGDAPAVAAVISESTFCSVEALVQDGSFLDLAPSYFADARFDNCARIAELSVPVLLIHGLSDDFVVPRHEAMLERAARTPPTTLLVPGAGHSSVPLVAGEAYDDAIVSFVRGVVGPG